MQHAETTTRQRAPQPDQSPPAAQRSAGAREDHLVAQAKALNAGDTVQRLEKLNAALRGGTLTRDQVRMPSLRQDLPAGEVASLAAQTASIGNANARPLAAAVGDGRATLGERGVTMPALRPTASGAGIAQAVAALAPRDTRLEVAGGRYALHTRLNPWIQVASGVITAVDNSHWKTNMGSGWTFVKNDDVKAAGLDPKNLLNKAWPPVTTPPVTTTTSPYTVPSSTYNPANMSVNFHNLPPDRLPQTPKGTAWTKQNNQWEHLRDPLVAPQSPQYNVEEDTGQGGMVYSSSISYGSQGKRIPLSVHSQTSSTGSTYKGPRDYPMTSKDYKDPNGVTMGRGHGIDHADGNQDTTSRAENYTPQNRHWNEGARNHLVGSQRREGGGSYSESYEYSATPMETVDGTPIPDRNHFTIDQGGTPAYFNIPTYGYPADRKKDAALTYKQSYGTQPKPTYF